MGESTRRLERIADELMRGAATLEDRGQTEIARKLRARAAALLDEEKPGVDPTAASRATGRRT